MYMYVIIEYFIHPVSKKGDESKDILELQKQINETDYIAANVETLWPWNSLSLLPASFSSPFIYLPSL